MAPSLPQLHGQLTNSLNSMNFLFKCAFYSLIYFIFSLVLGVSCISALYFIHQPTKVFIGSAVFFILMSFVLILLVKSMF